MSDGITFRPSMRKASANGAEFLVEIYQGDGFSTAGGSKFVQLGTIEFDR
jgi:hypothetical protein